MQCSLEVYGIAGGGRAELMIQILLLYRARIASSLLCGFFRLFFNAVSSVLVGTRNEQKYAIDVITLYMYMYVPTYWYESEI